MLLLIAKDKKNKEFNLAKGFNKNMEIKTYKFNSNFNSNYNHLTFRKKLKKNQIKILKFDKV